MRTMGFLMCKIPTKFQKRRFKILKETDLNHIYISQSLCATVFILSSQCKISVIIVLTGIGYTLKGT